MLFTFKSNSGPNLVMFEKGAQEILSLLGKNPAEAQGIITVEQLPGAIATLRTALSSAIASQKTREEKADEPDAEHKVSLSQRALPFIEMLERAKKDQEVITWGV